MFGKQEVCEEELTFRLCGQPLLQLGFCCNQPVYRLEMESEDAHVSRTTKNNRKRSDTKARAFHNKCAQFNRTWLQKYISLVSPFDYFSKLDIYILKNMVMALPQYLYVCSKIPLVCS